MTAEPTKASSESARELSRNHETLKMLLNGVTDYAIFMIDPAGIVLTWNTGAARLKGYPADEIIGQHFSRFYTQDAITTGHPERELQIAKAEGRYEEEGWRVRKDGTSFWANVVISPVSKQCTYWLCKNHSRSHRATTSTTSLRPPGSDFPFPGQWRQRLCHIHVESGRQRDDMERRCSIHQRLQCAGNYRQALFDVLHSSRQRLEAPGT